MTDAHFAARFKNMSILLAEIKPELTAILERLLPHEVPLTPAAGWGCTDGRQIFLPAQINLFPSAADNRALYRQILFNKALRIRAGLSPLPPFQSVGRDLFTVLEGERLLRQLQNLNADWYQEGRELALKLLVLRTPSIGPKARTVETVIRLVLGMDPRRVGVDAAEQAGMKLFRELPHPFEEWPAISTLGLISWAERRIERLPGIYTGVEQVPMWGEFQPAALSL